MLRNYMGIINLEEKEQDIRSLTANRPIGTVPIAGRFRVIDFVLSNMVNAGLTRISVFSEGPFGKRQTLGFGQKNRRFVHVCQQLAR